MNSVSNAASSQIQPPHSVPSSQPSSATNGPTPANMQPTTDPRVEGDRELAIEYRSALASTANGRRDATVHPIAVNSTFGQWWQALRDAFQSPVVRQWIRDKGIDPRSIKLKPASGQLTFTLNRNIDPKQVIHSVGQDDTHWAAISGPILQAARVIAAGHADSTFAPPTSPYEEPVPYGLVGRFYNEPQDLTVPAMRARASEIGRRKGFAELDPATFAPLIESRSEDALRAQKAYLGDTLNRYQVIAELQDLATAEPSGPIQDELKRRVVDLSAVSSYQATNGDKPTKASLLQLLEDHGWDIPTTQEHVANLAKALSTPTPAGPANGNLGGALSWPRPLEHSTQALLSADIRAGAFGELTLSPYDTVLDYLLDDRAITVEEQNNPRVLVDALINSPRGKALGEAIEATFATRGVIGTASEWLLTALNVERGEMDSQVPGQVHGYPLYSADQMGKSPSTIVKELTAHLVDNGLASSPEKATIRAHILLASQAPELLVREIPGQVVVGTHSWVSFATAAARIEAKAPGATAAMTYAQVMLDADIAPITDEERRIEYAAQREAITHWGAVNGFSYPTTDAEIMALREVYSAQISELKEAAQLQFTKMPTTNDIAMEQLKQAFPDMDPALFLEKTITSQPSNRDYPGPYSIRDLYIDDAARLSAPVSSDDWGPLGRATVNAVSGGTITIEPDGRPAVWVSSSKAIDLKSMREKLKTLPRPRKEFEAKFETYRSAVEKTVAAQLKLLISTQRPEIRKDLNSPNLRIRREIDYHRPDHPLRVTEGALLVETTRDDGTTMTYEINRLANTVIPRPGKTYDEYPPTNGMYPSKGKRYDVIKPEGERAPGPVNESKGTPDAPYSFSSPSTQYIVDAMIEDMNLPAVEKSARGVTTFDTEVPLYKVVLEVALNLIPFRSAIKNFIEGKTSDGFVDLAFDIFGFAVGLGTAAKGAKALGAGASALSKLGQAGKIIGRAAVGALNPLSGVDDLARGAFNVGRNAVSATYNGVKQLRGSYRSVNLLELANKADIAEGTYKAANSASASNVLAKFDNTTHEWHAFDPRTQRAYGKPLDNFTVDPPKTNNPNSLSALATKHTDGAGDIKGLTDSWFGKMIGSIVAPSADNPHFRRDYLNAITKANANDRAAYILGQNTGTPEQIYGYSSALNVDQLKRLAVAEQRTPAELGSLVKRIDELEALPARLDVVSKSAQIVDPSAYKKGRNAATPTSIPGFSKNLTNNQIAELAIVRGRTPEEVGQLIGFIEKRRTWFSRDNFTEFHNEILAAGGKATPLPQGFYLSQVDLLSEGECAALSNVMAAAVKHGKSQTFMDNLWRSMVPTLGPNEIAQLRISNPAKAAEEALRAKNAPRFHKLLNELQGELGANFHLGMQTRQVPYTTIISELASAKSSKTLLIQAPGHGITAGVVFNNGKKEWFYFDPNFGKATFTTEAGMRAGLESTLRSGKTKNILPHFGQNSRMPEYKISVFDELELNITTKTVSGQVPDLFRADL